MYASYLMEGCIPITIVRMVNQQGHWEMKKNSVTCLGSRFAGLLKSGLQLPSRTICLRLVVGVAPLCAVTAADADEATLPFTDPYVFVDRFSNSADVKSLGFPTGPKPFLTLGMIVEKEKAEEAGTPVDIVSATASNGKVTFDLIYADIGILDLWDNWRDGAPEFDPESQMGTWVITATDSKGEMASTSPVVLDHGFELPFVENAHAEKMESGELHVTWSAPALDPKMQEQCDVDYRVRLLRDGDNQLYRSSPTTEMSITVPAETVMEKVGDSLEGVWGRVEMACRDQNEKNNDGVGELEARSNTFFPLT